MSSSCAACSRIVVGDVGLGVEERPAVVERHACALDVVRAAARVSACVELGGALDRLLQVLVRGVEGEDGLAPRSLADRRSSGRAPRRARRRPGRRFETSSRVRVAHGVLVPLDLLADLARDRARSSSLTSLPKVSLKCSDALTTCSKSRPFFGWNDACRKRLLFEKVFRASSDDGGLDRLALAGRLDLPGAQQREHEAGGRPRSPSRMAPSRTRRRGSVRSASRRSSRAPRCARAPRRAGRSRC